MSDRLEIPEIVLASSSPRRRMLLNQVGIPFTVIQPEAREMTPENGNFVETVTSNARAKAVSVIDRAEGRLVLGADTIVNLDGIPLGKPSNSADAKRMLTMLSGRTHLVVTGIALIDPTRDIIRTDHAVTKVTFRTLTPVEIDDYIRTGEPFDKAGSYGIQARGALFIERVEGCFFNVMGLPLARLWEMLLQRER